MEREPVTIIGSYLSPYVRKVLVVLEVKGVPYRIDPIIPFFGSDAFDAVSPVRRIPVLIDDRVTLADSSAICEYLEDRYADVPMLPSTPEDRARSRWLEEFADTRMGEVIVWRLFNQTVINRFVWGEQKDDDVFRRARDEELPKVLAYLESQLPAEGFLFGDTLGLADAAIAAVLRNAAFARVPIDAARWPRCAAFVDRAWAHSAFAKLAPYEALCLKTPIPGHREVLKEAGAPITDETYATATPRRGVMTI